MLSDRASRRRGREYYQDVIDKVCACLKTVVIVLFLLLICSQVLLQNDGVRRLLVNVERMEGVRLN